MNDPRALRNTRLTNEYRELMELNKKSRMIQCTPLGNAPYQSYRVVFNVRTIIGPGPDYRDRTVCTLTIPPNYPDAAPTIMADETPYPFHINWFKSGRWCYGSWNREESLVNYLIRCARTLQFDPEIANTGSVANHDAVSFWQANKNNRRVIPCDRQPLPVDPATGQITIRERTVPKIVVKSQPEKPKITIK